MFQDGMKSDTDDIFHDVVMSEERSQVEGYQEGLVIGKKTGLQEGYRLGWEKGAAINSELGFYYGFAKTLIESLEKTPKSKQRAQKTLQSLIQKIETFPRHDPVHSELQEQLASIRAKFKQVLYPIEA